DWSVAISHVKITGVQLGIGPPAATRRRSSSQPSEQGPPGAPFLAQDSGPSDTLGVHVPSQAPGPPHPPSRASLGIDGRLKDTRASRALCPSVTPAEDFQRPVLVKQAYYADEPSLVF